MRAPSVQLFSRLFFTIATAGCLVLSSGVDAVCTDDKGNTYNAGDKVIADNSCQRCYCAKNGQIKCYEKVCMKHCPGLAVYEPGRCCPRCVTGCVDSNNVIYSVDAPVESDNPCETCKCSMTGAITCEEVRCSTCEGEVVPVEGQCCGNCLADGMQSTPINGCVKDGTYYNFGDQVPVSDPCQECYCYEYNGGEIKCSSVVCEPCAGTRVPVKGACCGECQDLEVCEWDGKRYAPGDQVPVSDPCQECYCYEYNGGEVKCSSVACEPCAGTMVPVEGSCCGECQEAVDSPP